MHFKNMNLMYNNEYLDQHFLNCGSGTSGAPRRIWRESAGEL